MNRFHPSLPKFTGILYLFFSLSILLVIGFGLSSSVRPLLDAAPGTDETTWMLVVLALLVAVGLLSLLYDGRLLLIILCLAGMVFFLVPLLFSEAAPALLASVFIAASAFLWGSFLLLRFGFKPAIPALDLFAVRTLAGFGALMILSTLMGFLGLYYPITAWAIFIAPFILSLPIFISAGRCLLQTGVAGILKNLKKGSTFAWFMALFVICGLAAYLWALTPATRWDSMAYHIPVPLHYIRNHAIVELPETIQSYYAHYSASLNTLALLVTPSTALPGLLHFQMGLLTVLMTYILGRQLGGRIHGLVAALLFWSIPAIQFEIGSAYVELFTAAYISALVYGLWWWNTSHDDRWLLFSGVFAGIALGIKLTAFFPILVIFVYLCARLIYQQRASTGALRKVLVFTIPLVLIAAPWFWRDFYWTGNPVFPSYDQFFHSPKIIPELQYNEFRPTVRKLNVFFTLPVKLLTDSRIFFHELPGYAFGGLFIFSLPWLYPWFSEKNKRAVLIQLAVFSFLVILLSFQVNPVFRYLITVFPFLSILAAENFLVISRWLSQHLSAKKITVLGIGVASLYLFTTLAVGVNSRLQVSGWIPYRYAFGLESSTSFLDRSLPFYSAFRYLEENERKPLKIYSMGIDFRLYTTAQIYNTNASREAWDLLHGSKDGEEFIEKLQVAKYTHLLIYSPEVERRPWAYSSPIISNQFLNRYTRPVFAQGPLVVYELLYDPGSRAGAAANLLHNPGFEVLSSGGIPVGWEFSGSPLISSAGEDSHTGMVAVQVLGPSLSGVSQIVTIESGAMYTAGYWANPADENQILQANVQWLDQKQQLMEQSVEWISLEPGWRLYTAYFRAPEKAAYARFIVTTAAGGSTWVDDPCLSSFGSCP